MRKLIVCNIVSLDGATPLRPLETRTSKESDNLLVTYTVELEGN
ncbi:MAG: hypothetical protein ACRDNR_17685 [Gaiellaceae bacterium]